MIYMQKKLHKNKKKMEILQNLFTFAEKLFCNQLVKAIVTPPEIFNVKKKYYAHK